MWRDVIDVLGIIRTRVTKRIVREKHATIHFPIGIIEPVDMGSSVKRAAQSFT